MMLTLLGHIEIGTLMMFQFLVLTRTTLTLGDKVVKHLGNNLKKLGNQTHGVTPCGTSGCQLNLGKNIREIGD
jgi:hypothetical protein